MHALRASVWKWIFEDVRANACIYMMCMQACGCEWIHEHVHVHALHMHTHIYVFKYPVAFVLVSQQVTDLLLNLIFWVEKRNKLKRYNTLEGVILCNRYMRLRNMQEYISYNARVGRCPGHASRMSRHWACSGTKCWTKFCICYFVLFSFGRVVVKCCKVV